MARKPRFSLPGVPQHIIQRGNNRLMCFHSSLDYGYYLDCLKEAAQRYDVSIHAYVLMTNHAHILATPQRPESISHMMQVVGQRYVRYVNFTYQRSGTLWEGRYKAGLVESERYLLTCMRYIELNPVRAGMVEAPPDYQWSSFRANAYGDESDVITPHSLYLQLGTDLKQRLPAYRALFDDAIGKTVLEQIRGTLNKEMVLGNTRFKEDIEAMTQRQVSPKDKGRPFGLNNVTVY